MNYCRVGRVNAFNIYYSLIARRSYVVNKLRTTMLSSYVFLRARQKRAYKKKSLKLCYLRDKISTFLRNPIVNSKETLLDSSLNARPLLAVAK